MAPRFRRKLPGWAALTFLVSLAGCGDAQLFALGRIEALCDGAVPVCNQQASCIVDDEKYVRGYFPGERRVVVRSERVSTRLVVRLLLTDLRYPGTELLIQAYSPDCGDVAVEQMVDVDLFELAGDDRVFEVHLDLPESGDHLVSVFSDMDADYLMTTTVEDGP